MRIETCQYGHDYVYGFGGCRECKRRRDREHQAKKPKKPATDEQRQKNRERYAKRSSDPQWRKKTSKRTYQAFRRRVESSPEAMDAHKARMKARWDAIKSDPERLEREREAARKSSRKYRLKEFSRPDPKLIASRLLFLADKRAREERDGIRRVG